MVTFQAEHEADLNKQSLERHRTYQNANPEQKCLKCALKLSQHTTEEFQYCEFVLAGSGQETLVMNRP